MRTLSLSACLSWRSGFPVGVACALAAACLATAAKLDSKPSTLNPQPSTNSHWAFIPPRDPPVPKVRNTAWIRTTVDNFILARLEKEGIAPAPESGRATLIRRLSFDLLGLPPTPAETEAFVNDTGSDACERLVERLLASPHYGERWGRHWLDVSGYADSNGYFDADSDRPLAHKYRDYVIKAFNDDKPFDRFVREQIDGDELAGYQPDGDVTPGMLEALIATHFLRNAPDGTGESDGNPDELRVDRYSVLEGNVQLIGSALLGITMQCCRCHDHKFEPVSQEEYYRLQAILRPAFDPDKWLKPNQRVITVAMRAEREEHKRRLDLYDRELKARKEALEGLIQPFHELRLSENLESLDENARVAIRKALETKEKQRTEEMKVLLKKHEAIVQIKDDDLLKQFPEIAAGYKSLTQEIKKQEAEKPPPLPQIAALNEPGGRPPSHHLLKRGLHKNPGREIEPGVPAILCTANNAFSLAAAFSRPTNSQPSTLNPQLQQEQSAPPRAGSVTGSGRRLAFARWLTSPEHPTFARLMVNRFWHYHLGQGIVATTDNFGVTGAKPVHPELLDWLAVQFVRSGWSVKAMHRLIVNSATYRQSSSLDGRESKAEGRGARQGRMALDARPSTFDPDNRLLWRFPLRRLDAEAIRDAMLCVTGELDPSVGGPYVPTDKTEEGQYVVNEQKTPGYRRRSLYLQQKRTKPLTTLDVFDGAQMNPNCTRRNTTTMPLQSLALLNSDFVRRRGRLFAERLAREAGAEGGNRLTLAFELAYGRKPDAGERGASEEFLQSQTAQYAGKADGDTRVWTDFCQMLLASNPFLYVE